jgi:hypothetical protein
MFGAHAAPRRTVTHDGAPLPREGRMKPRSKPPPIEAVEECHRVAPVVGG